MVTIVRWLMILAAIMLSPFYALWVAGGAICDARERRRRSSSSSRAARAICHGD